MFEDEGLLNYFSVTLFFATDTTCLPVLLTHLLLNYILTPNIKIFPSWKI